MGIIVISIIAAITDYCYHRIPNVLIALGLIGGLLQVGRKGGYVSLLDCISRSVVVILLLFLFFACGMLGAGDVKLLALSPLYLSSSQTLEVYTLTLVIAAVWALILILRRGDLTERLRKLAAYIGCISRGRLVQYQQELGEVMVIPLAVPFMAAVMIILYL